MAEFPLFDHKFQQKFKHHFANVTIACIIFDAKGGNNHSSPLMAMTLPTIDEQPLFIPNDHAKQHSDSLATVIE